METLYYVRHGITPDNLDERWCGGGNDAGLHPAGVEQAESVARKIAETGIKPDIIISSPRLRARQTVQPIAAAIGYPDGEIVISDLFNERDFGTLEGQPHDAELLASYYENETAVDNNGGENFAPFHARASQGLEYLRGLDYKTGLVVAHGTLHRALERHIYQLPVDAPWPQPLGNAEMRKYDLTQPAVSIDDKRGTDFDSNLSSDIYAFHLSIRQWQIDNQNNVFSNFYESKEDLPRIDEYYLEPGGNFFVATNDKTKEIAGIVGLRNDGNGLGEIKRMAVHPKLHRQKIGIRLVHELVNWARSEGFTKLHLFTGENENAKPLYEKFGFEVIGRVERNGDYEMQLNIS